MGLKCRKCGGDHLTLKCEKNKKQKYKLNKSVFVCVRITNLPLDISIKELSKLLKEWGDIGKINFNEHHNGKSAFINFFIKEEAEYFVNAMNGTIFDNDIINVDLLQ
jgi:hypothetical protein